MTADSPTRAGSARLQVGDREVELPVVEGTEGDDALDIGRLRGETGHSSRVEDHFSFASAS